MKKIILLVTFFLALGNFSSADSPLTSTNFFSVYEEYDIVKDAIDANGSITNELMLYLSDKTYPIDVKVAVVNALGWNFNGQHNYDTYLNFIEMRLGLTADQEAFNQAIDEDELLCLAYLKAMDNYFDVTEAKNIAEMAINKSRRSNRSYTFNLINALIGAQMQMQGDWCKLYKDLQAVRKNNALKMDFPVEADKIIFDYIQLYKNACKN